ncbi:MAG: SelB C-terminal domain-containing protein, partial [Acidobacteriota bacterium]
DSLSGDGIDELRQTMLREIQALPREDLDRRIEDRVFRLPVDRVFTIRGFGTVITGTAISGSLRRDEPVQILPGNFQSKVRSIEIFGEAAERADAGQRTALNLPNVARSDLRRGMTVCAENSLRSGMTANVQLELLADSPSRLRHRMPIRFHHGSAEMIAHTYLFDRTELKPGETAIVQLRLEEPAVLLPGDPFIVRRYSPLITIGGGVILDNDPPRLRRRQVAPLLEEYRELLPRLIQGGRGAQRLLLAQRIRRQGVRSVALGDLVAATGLKQSVILELLGEMEGIGVIAQEPTLIIDLSVVDGLAEQLRLALDSYHARHPLAAGMPREELRERFLTGAPAQVVQFVLDELQQRGIIDVRAGNVALAGSTVRLSEEQERLRERLLGSLRKNPFQSPGPTLLAKQIGEPVEPVRNLFYYLIESGEILKVSEELVVLPEQLDDLVTRLRNEFPEGRTITVPEFKDVLGLSRKYAIPVLEYLDRIRVTRRRGDGRTLVENKS